jgi:hypothetical protein
MSSAHVFICNVTWVARYRCSGGQKSVLCRLLAYPVNSHFGCFRSEADISAYKKRIYEYTLAPAPPLVPTGTPSALAAGERRAAHRVMPRSRRKPT